MEVLQEAAKVGLQINCHKCQLMRERIQFLGYVVEEGRIAPSTEKTAALANFSKLRTPKQLQRFLGLAGYFRKFTIKRVTRRSRGRLASC